MAFVKSSLNLHTIKFENSKAMERVLNKFFSMSVMAVFLLLFFLAIGVATFVENDFGTPVAQKLIYKALWFECILAYLFLSLCFNIYRYKLWQISKLGSLVFHISFLIIVIGAWITRIFGFEGAMLIREGESSNVIISTETYLQIKVHDFKSQYLIDLPMIVDGYTNNYFHHEFDFPQEKESIAISFLDLKEGVKDTLIAAEDGVPFLEIVTVQPGGGRRYNYLQSGQIIQDGALKIGFNYFEETDVVSIFETDSGIFVKTPFELNYLQMADQSQGVIANDSVQRFIPKRLYTGMNSQFVFNTYLPKAKLTMVESEEIPRDMKAMTVLVEQGELKQEVVLRGGKGTVPFIQPFQLGKLTYELGFGSKEVELPFSIFLNDFELERYPGTENPSSFSSKVKLIDMNKGYEEDFHIYMNNVLDYGGYRFFQSSYDKDELGTILSVNYDAPGTLVTYIGYFLLGLGFVISLISKGGRFRYLLKKSNEIRAKRESLTSVVLLFLLLGGGSVAGFSQKTMRDSDLLKRENAITPVIDLEHSEKFARLVIQDQGGRFQPVHTMATDVLKKLHRSTSFNGQSATQVFVGIHTNFVDWNFEPLILVSGEPLREKLKVEKYAAFVDFFTVDFEYILQADAEAARLKKPSEQSLYDKDVLKTDERLGILYGIFSGAYLKILPLPNDPEKRWFSPFEPELPFQGADAEFANSIVPMYTMAVNHSLKTKDWQQADMVVKLIDDYQREFGDPNAIPSTSKIELEIFYNKAKIFDRLTNIYIIIALVILFVAFLSLFLPKYRDKWVGRIAVVITYLMVGLHAAGLGIRWYLSGHAPWSNGYEAVVFIGFITMVAGLLFARKNKIVLGAAGLLGWLLLFVAQLNSLDPEITQLVPVLKSYWLMIHVAIITGSYAFLGLGAILGLICLILNLTISPNNKKRIQLTTKELTYVSEMVIMIGLFMLTIGTFLGGIWANESWGRYWGWDAKETWALASVLIYAIVMHFRFVPGLKGQFAFNVASLWAYGAIIMTFFGVNYYLSGLHSYATGDPVPIPTWVPITVLLLLILSVFSGIKNKRNNETELVK
jgi:cytochrome c-type biogenesis protein CcsB